MEGDETFALDVADFLLANISYAAPEYTGAADYAAGLNELLRRGGSVWEVVPIDEEIGYQLARRAIGPVREAIAELAASGRAHQHLVAAWNRLSGRNPDTTGAYREAVRAVEAVAKPVILPNSHKATLGTMIAAMRDKPEKWEVTLGSVDDVRRMMEQIWTNQLDRHGTDDETVPLTVSPEQADVAVHWAIAVVRLFAGGHVRSVAQVNAA